MTYQKDRSTMRTNHRFLLFFLLFISSKLDGQIIVKEFIGEKCNTYLIENKYEDSLFYISQCLACKVTDSCIEGVVYEDHTKKKCTIYISHSNKDFDWVIPNWVTLKPGKSLSYKIENNFNSEYNRTFEFYARAVKVRKNDKKYRTNSIRKLKGNFYVFKLE